MIMNAKFNSSMGDLEIQWPGHVPLPPANTTLVVLVKLSIMTFVLLYCIIVLVCVSLFLCSGRRYQGGICRGKPGNFPLTGSDLPSHWFVWKLRGNGNGEGRERGKGRVGETTCLTSPHWLLPQIPTWTLCRFQSKLRQNGTQLRAYFPPIPLPNWKKKIRLKNSRTRIVIRFTTKIQSHVPTLHRISLNIVHNSLSYPAADSQPASQTDRQTDTRKRKHVIKHCVM